MFDEDDLRRENLNKMFFRKKFGSSFQEKKRRIKKLRVQYTSIKKKESVFFKNFDVLRLCLVFGFCNVQ